MAFPHRSERRASMAERRPSVSYTPPVIPHLAGLEKPQDLNLKLELCDVLILGTGLVESILAAALSWQGVEVLHLDNKTNYGDSLSTLTIEQLKKWVLEVNQGKIQHFQDAQIYIPGGKSTNKFQSRDYGIDLTPKIMFCKSDLLALLIKSRVYKYLEFQSLSNFHVFENDDFNKRVTNSTSKQDIFTDASLSLLTKRYLMKFLKFILQDNNDPIKKKLIAQHQKVPISEFLLKQFNLELPQVNELTFSIGLCTKEDALTPEAISKIQRFLVSFDVYGNFPVMISKYGGPGEISQGFCRSAAVAGTTYKLGTSLTDYDPKLKIAKFNDGSSVKIKEKIIISPTQVPKFLQQGYQDVTKDLKPFHITRLITVVRRDCKEWMSDLESSAVVAFPPHSLPTDNLHSVQVIIQNGGSGVCPVGQAIWFSHTTEQDLDRAKADLEAAYEKMEVALLRESSPSSSASSSNSSDFDNDILGSDPQELMINNGSTVANSFKLGESLQSFMPKDKLEIVCKLGYVQKTYVNHDLSNVFHPKEDEENNVVLKNVGDVIFSNMPSSEISYDGIISESKLIYQKITGSDEDFFDVDFEDDDDEYSRGNGDSVSGVSGGPDGASSDPTDVNVLNAQDHARMLENENAIDDSDDDGHQPFAADEMEL